MKKLSFVIGLSILAFHGLAHAEDNAHPRRQRVKQNIQNKAENNCNGDQACVDRETKWMNKRAQAVHSEIKDKCNGDKDCLGKARDNLADKRDALRDEIQTKCPNGGDDCKREVVKNRDEKFRENHPEMTK